MSKRKYQIYQVVADYGTVNEETNSYREAFKLYHKTSNPKTMYGIDDMGAVSVIASHS